MKLRNKKTGEILKDVRSSMTYKENIRIYDEITDNYFTYNSLAELNSEWEDVPEEPKTFWAISWAGEPEEYDAKKTPHELKDMAKSIGNYFETKEEAEKAVAKLRAWKRLKDKGFKLEGWTIDDGLRVSICTNLDSDGIYDEARKETKKDLDICFGGEE